MQKKNEEMQKLHSSVLLKEVAKAFGEVKKIAHLNKELKIIDATLGLGGHTEMLVKNGFNVLGIDTDLEMLKLASMRLKIACPTPTPKAWGSYKLIQGNFRKIKELATKMGFEKVGGILFDLGVSSPQIDSPDRGFSFKNPLADLDMRMDRENLSVKAVDLLNFLRKDQLMDLFRETLSYRDAANLSKNILYAREVKKLENAGEVINIIKNSIKAKSNLNVATLPFLALRMAVNREIDNLKDALVGATDLIEIGGRLVVISFHSGEDSIVKSYFSEVSKSGRARIVTKDPIIATLNEIELNPRSRSAKMRILQII